MKLFIGKKITLFGTALIRRVMVLDVNIFISCLVYLLLTLVDRLMYVFGDYRA